MTPSSTQSTGLSLKFTLAMCDPIRRNLKTSLIALASTLILQLAPEVGAHDGLPGSGPVQTNQPIPSFEIGAQATAQYTGEGLAVYATESGAVRLRCTFQRLEGEVTPQGLRLTSTVPDNPHESFRVVADYLGRDSGVMVALPEDGTPRIDKGRARFERLGLVEEYSVSVDGVEQELTVTHPPHGTGPLRVEMSVEGASVGKTPSGVKLVLDKSARTLAYHRLRVVDAVGKKLGARMERVCASRLAVVVDDRGARYPVQIDPTFSDANWVSVGGPDAAPSSVFAVAMDSSGNVYVGGSFTLIGTVVATNIARWDGTSWSALGAGISGGSPTAVNALAVVGTSLCAGGSFTSAGGVQATNIAQWNGSGWSALGSGMNGVVNALVASGTDLYAGGSFTTAGGNSANNIAHWNGSTWLSLGSGMNGNVNALQFYQGYLHAGGAFTTAGGVVVNNIAKWNGITWTSLSYGVSNLGAGGVVNALAVSQTFPVSQRILYVGGSFSSASGAIANNIAMWNGSSWSRVGSGLTFSSHSSPPPVVYALAVLGTNLYAGGSFTMADNVWVNFVAQWNGNNWWVAGDGMNGYVRALAVSGTSLYAGGSFTTPDNAIARFDGTSWWPLTTGNICSLALLGTDLYAAGIFGIPGSGSYPATRISRWDGTSWTTLPSRLQSGITPVLAVSGTNLYAAAFITLTNGGVLYDVDRWDGGSWSTLGVGKNEPIYALVTSGTNLFAGGQCWTSGNCVTKWDGNSWLPLGSGVTDPDGPIVISLAGCGTNLYAGGRFKTAGGVAATNIAVWNGSSWSALGSGLIPSYFNYYAVHALAVSGTNVFAGGMFTNAGGVAAKNIAQWNGSNWSALDSGIENSSGVAIVISLAVSGSHLFVGGDFTSAGGVSTTNIAEWDGSHWLTLGSGMNNPVDALILSGADLYAGGGFTTVGGKPIASIAKARVESIADSVIESNAIPTITFFGVIGYQYDVQRASSLVAPVTWTTITTNALSPAADGSFSFTDVNAPGDMAYYRSVQR